MKHLFYLNKFFWKYRTLLAIGSVLIIIANLFAVEVAEFVREAFDAVILSMNKKNETIANTSKILLKYGSLIILFALLKGVFMYFMRQTIIVMSRKIEYDALKVLQKGSTFELHIDNSSLGYSLDGDDEIVAWGKFNS